MGGRWEVGERSEKVLLKGGLGWVGGWTGRDRMGRNLLLFPVSPSRGCTPT